MDKNEIQEKYNERQRKLGKEREFLKLKRKKSLERRLNAEKSREKFESIGFVPGPVVKPGPKAKTARSFEAIKKINDTLHAIKALKATKGLIK
jgi:hypothetical protein